LFDEVSDEVSIDKSRRNNVMESTRSNVVIVPATSIGIKIPMRVNTFQKIVPGAMTNASVVATIAATVNGVRIFLLRIC